MKENGTPIVLKHLPMLQNDLYTVSRWKLFFEDFAQLQMDADYRMVRFKELKWPAINGKVMLKRWGALLNDDIIVDILVKQEDNVKDDTILTAVKGEKNSVNSSGDSKATLIIEKLLKYSENIIEMSEKLESARCPPESLHFDLTPLKCYEAIIKTKAPKPSNAFACYGVDRGVIAHPFLTIQRFFDFYPDFITDNNGFNKSTLDGTFEGKEPVYLQRRAIRDEYLKCWKRWTKLGESRKLFNTARHLFQVFEATRLWNDIETEFCPEYDVPRTRNIIVKRLKNVLEIIKLMEAKAANGNIVTEAVTKTSGLRPVNPWKNGMIQLESDDGTFSRKINVEDSLVSVSELIWDELGLNEDEAEVKSPRVRGVYVGFDLDLHDNGIRDGDKIVFKLTTLEKIVEEDNEGRLPDTFKAWHALPPVVVYKDNIVRRPKHPDILHVDGVTYPAKLMKEYHETKINNEKNANSLDKTFRERRGY